MSKATLACFGDAPTWIAAWCVKQKDLRGFTVYVSESTVPSMPLLVVVLRWDDRKASQQFFPDYFALRNAAHLGLELDRLAAITPPTEDSDDD